ncbi:hypothetical protein SSX86_015453 [Deinandra increscens subsp. villosa]|uniref:RST domain-containing protein n=1 Tax=Deinandra increscens subsp. villosa TaxID=3103831 RepID=A0AAP0D1G9_9ASTR
MQKMGNNKQQPLTTGKPANAMKRPPMGILIPALEAQLDEVRAAKLRGLYAHLQMMEKTSNQPAQIIAKPSGLPIDNNAQKPLLPDSHEVHKSVKVNAIKQEKDQPFSVQGLGEQGQQEHMPFTQLPVSNYGDIGRSYSSPNMNMSSSSLGLQQSSWQPLMHRDQSLMSSMAYVKQEPLDYMNRQQHNCQISAPQAPSSVSLFEPLEEETFEMMSACPAFSTPMNTQEPISVTTQLERQIASAGSSSLAAGGNAKSPQETPTVGQKKASEAPVSSLSKKQKVSEALSDQSIEQLNDVTAASGVNLRLPDDDGDVEHLDSNQERRELVENVSPMSDSVEKFASSESDIICIQGYKVKRSNATILEAIFKKHGDIAANCVLKTLSARTYLLEVICEVVRQIQTQDLIEMGEDIECQVSDAEAVNINVSWIRAHFDAIRKSKKTSENHSLLMAMKEKMMLVIKAAEMDRAKRSLELSAADKRVEKFSPQSGIVCVHGYNVKRSNATILEAIFKKHGDIAAACVFRTDSMRASILEIVCEVVRQMQTNEVIKKMEELECRVLDAEAANIDVTWLRANLEAISKRKETSKKYNMLMKMKENTIMLKKVVQVDWRERCSEHVAVKQRLEKAEKSIQHSGHMSRAMSMQNVDKSPNIGQTPEDESQLQRMDNQQAMTTGQPANAMNQPAKQVLLAQLLSAIEAQLDIGKVMQLRDLYARLRSNNINKDEFVRHMRSLVGDHMLKKAVDKVQLGLSAGNSSLASGSNAKTLKDKPTVGQKKPSEAFVSSLSKKQKVCGVFSDQSIEQLNDTTAVIGVNHRLLDDDGDVELLDSKPKRCELVENVSPMSDSVEKFSFPQSEIVCIQGYKMKRSSAAILEAIFKKHGDIAANCIFKTLSTRTHLLEVICEVVRQIQTRDMTEIGEDIESQVSDAETANINVSWIRAHFETIHKSKETSENHRLLVEMKENAILVKQIAQMDLRKRSLELMAAEEQFKVAERCVRVLHLVEKNLNDRILESESKIDSWVKHSLV